MRAGRLSPHHLFLDRPDVLAIYTVRIEADAETAPVLLSNGNPVSAGKVPGTARHFAIWHDPHPKPSYLFALVGGNLAQVPSRFTTASGRDVALNIYVEPGKEDRCGWAMESLKRAMRWDEERFGREYDLDVFNIVAVSDFNMGAMENKGLNIFNDKLVLARPDTASDADYGAIEGVIAHEYFHNWTGDRVTCRDWFQLCLKEGLTVFRDQEFTADMRSGPVKRILDVRALKNRQFPEDAGPLAHPVRPASYIEINNFYTATVYEKGAELCRMLQTLLGREDSAKASTFTSSAMTERRRRSRISSLPWPIAPDATSPNSCSGITRPARRSSPARSTMTRGRSRHGCPSIRSCRPRQVRPAKSRCRSRSSSDCSAATATTCRSSLPAARLSPMA